jgi:uncharacterized protein YndB with AHSA1/START domain
MTEAAIIQLPVRRIAPDTIRLERVLDAPIETVWRYLTEAELRRQWFMGGTSATGVGPFDLLIDHDNLSDDDVPYPESYASSKGLSWTEQVSRFEPPRLLETTFQGGKNGTVRYELSADGERRENSASASSPNGDPGHRRQADRAHAISPPAPSGLLRATVRGVPRSP